MIGKFVRWLLPRPDKIQNGEERQREQLAQSVFPAVRQSQKRIARLRGETQQRLDDLKDTSDRLRVNIENTLARLRRMREHHNDV